MGNKQAKQSQKLTKDNDNNSFNCNKSKTFTNKYNINCNKDNKFKLNKSIFKKKHKDKELSLHEKKLQFLQLSFKNTGVEFSEKELINLKLKLTDTEKHFGTYFDYFICYNSYLFQQRINEIYDNYNKMIESFKKPRIKLFVEFDCELESDGYKLDFDTLLTITLEKLEIETIIYFDFTNTDNVYFDNFFNQLIESIEMYKYNRKFDNLYFLLTNTDYLVKYENYLIYCTYKDYGLTKEYYNLLLSSNEKVNYKKNKERCKDMNYYFQTGDLIYSKALDTSIKINKFVTIKNEKINMYDKTNIEANYETCKTIKSDNTSFDNILTINNNINNTNYQLLDIKNKYIHNVFSVIAKEKLVRCRYAKHITQEDEFSQGYRAFANFINYVKPKYIKTFVKFNLDIDYNNIIEKNPLDNIKTKKFDINPDNNLFSTFNIIKLNNTFTNLKSERMNATSLRISNNVYNSIEKNEKANELSFKDKPFVLQKDLISSMFNDENKESIKVLEFLTSKVPYIVLIIDLLDEKLKLKNNENILILIAKILESGNNTDLSETYLHIKFIINQTKDNNSSYEKNIIKSNIKSEPYKQFLSCFEEIKKMIRVLEKKQSRVFVLELIEVSNVEKSKTSVDDFNFISEFYKQEVEQEPNENLSDNLYYIVYDRIISKWQSKKSIVNVPYILSLLAKKFNNLGLLEEEIITLINSFISLQSKTITQHFETVTIKKEAELLLY